MNPFAPPQADLNAPAAFGTQNGSFYVRDNTLIARKGTVLPNICLWSGEALGAERVHKRLYWAPPWTVIFVLSPVIYLIVYFIARKSAELDFSFGPAAKARRQNALMYGGSAMILSVLLTGIGISQNLPLLIAAPCLTFFVALIYMLVAARTMTVVRIDADDVHLKLRPAAASAFARASAG